jgi:hypothetical protein
MGADPEFYPTWIPLVDSESGCELHFKHDGVLSASVNLIVEKHNCLVKKVGGFLVIY